MGQFAGLGSTADGTTLYFSTPLRLHGSSSPFNDKILRFDTQLSEFLSRDAGESIGWTSTNFYDLMAAQPSSDGSVVAISASRGCYGGSGCLAVQTTQSVILDSSGKQLFVDYGYVSMSPNGRWALFYARNGFGNLVTDTELVDLTTGKATTVPNPYTFTQRPRRQVANDGTVALVFGSQLLLWSSGGAQTLAGASPMPATYANDPQILFSADGGKIVYQTAKGLAIYDRAVSAETPLTATASMWASMSDDASVIAFVSSVDSQVWLASPLRQLTKEPDGITEVTLSGNGRVAFAATNGGRLLRIDVATGAVTELIPRSPWITDFPSPVAPGSLYQFSGRNLAPAGIRIAGLDAPIQALSSEAGWFQAPWELPVQDAAPVEYLSGDSPLESPPGAVAVQTVAPGSFTTDYTVLAAHQDFSGLIANDSPAIGGEVIAIYLNGLGPVSPPAATGAVAPASPLAWVTGPLRCQFWDGGPNDSRIYFAGMAPGMVGVYQVSVQVPAGLRVNPVTVTCDFGADTPSVSGLLPVKL
jgi:uncharacterized protein (TIGR03437 family)